MTKYLLPHVKSQLPEILYLCLFILVLTTPRISWSQDNLPTKTRKTEPITISKSPGRVVIEKTIVVHQTNGKAGKTDKDRNANPLRILRIPQYPDVQTIGNKGMDGVNVAIPSEVPPVSSKVYPKVKPLAVTGQDEQSGSVPIYSLPPSLSTYPSVPVLREVGEDNSGGVGKERPREMPRNNDKECIEILPSQKPSSIKSGDETENDEKTDISIKSYNAEASTVIFYEGFEGIFPGDNWVLYGDPTWDDDDYKPYSGNWSGWCAKGGNSGLDPEFNNYPNNVNAWAVYGPFSLSDAISGSFSFRFWAQTELYYDYFKYLVSTDGTYFYGYQISGNSGGWLQREIDFTDVPGLGNICGEDQVWIAFIFESDSSNTYKGAFVDEVYIQKSANEQIPNLTPYLPPDWDDKIVVSNQPGTNSENTVYAGDVAYIDYAYINNGTADIGNRFYSEFYVNGSSVRRSYMEGLAVNNAGACYDYEYIFPAAGTYTLKLVVDVDNDVNESNESDNEYQRDKSVPSLDLPNLTPYQPFGWDDKIVVSNQPGTNSENTVYAGDVAYIDYAYINNGTADIGNRFYSEFYVNGSSVRRSYMEGLAVNNAGACYDYEYIFPAAGTYTLKLVVDVDNDVNESNESDNEYQRQKAIIEGDPIIRIQPTSLTINQEEDSSLDWPRGNFIPFFRGIEGKLKAEPRLNIIQSEGNRLEVKLAAQGMFVEDRVENGKTYKVIHLGRYNGELPPGQPNLPVVRKYVYVPQGKSSDLQVNLGDSITFQNYVIYPMQQPQLDRVGARDEAFFIDEVVYNTDDWFPKEMVYLGPVEMIRGHAIRLLSICPFQYNPAKKILRVFPEINVQVLFNGQARGIDSRLRSVLFDRFIKGFVLNSNAFDKAELGTFAYVGEDYLIISAPAFETQANELRDHKINRGIPAAVVSTDNTGTTSGEIKSYIQNAYDTWRPAPTYVLLFGDVETIPTTYDGTSGIGTDLYYSTVDGTDYLPDLFLGRISVDTVEEAQAVVQKIINYESNPPQLPSFYSSAAVVAYFQDGNPYPGEPDGYEDRRFVRTSEEVRGFLLNEGYNVQRIYFAETSANPTNYNDGLYGSGEPLPPDLLRANGFSWDGDAADISAAINGGTFLVLQRDHGMDRNDYFSHTGWGHPYYDETHIAALNNRDLLPVVMSISCQTGWFDGETDQNPSLNYESFAELFLRKFDGGAVGVFAATRNSYSGYNDFLAEGIIDCVWPAFLPTIPNSSIAQLGPMMNHGKLAMDQLWGDAWGLRQEEYELFHVHGDPGLEMWTNGSNGVNTFTIYNDGTGNLEITDISKRDGDLWLSWTPTATVTEPLTIYPGGSQIITVTVDWNQVPGSWDDERILIYSNDDDLSPYPDAVYVTAEKMHSCDVNGDGDVTPQDALCAFQKYLGICPTNCGDCDDIYCDVNGDGQCTPADALEIFKEYLGIVPNACSPE